MKQTNNNMELTNNDIFVLRLALQEQIKEANKWLCESQQHNRQESVKFWQERVDMNTGMLEKLQYK